MQKTRGLDFSLRDGASVLYSEHTKRSQNAKFQMDIKIDLYGRNWTLDLRSTPKFEALSGSSQPLTILVGGFIIDLLLLGLFLSMARSNKRAAKISKKNDRGGPTSKKKR